MRVWDEKMETLSGATLEELQLGRLRATLERIWGAGAPYRSRMEEAGLAPSGIKGMGDLERLPFSVKQDFKDNYPLGMLAVPPEKVVRFHASSGTTGSRTLVAYTAGDLENWAELVARFATAAGVVPSDVAQISFSFGLFTGGFGLQYGLERIGTAVVPASAGNTELQLSLISELGSTVFVGTPTYALHLIEEGTSIGFDFSRSTLRLGLFGAEPWSEGIRTRLEGGMGISATDNYGLSEVVGPGVSGECELKDGMHISEDHFIAEVVDPETGKTLADGQRGELVLTTLTREAVPVVRFRTGDLTVLDRRPCDCGRKNARMSRVLGRTDDMLIIRGVNVYPSQVETVLLEIEGVEPHYFIVVDRERELDLLEVWVEVSDEVFSNDERDIKRFAGHVEARLKAALNVRARVSLKEPGTLQRAVGKSRRILDRRDAE